jgi:hypothetical protein
MELISPEQRGVLLRDAQDVLKVELLDYYAADVELFLAWKAGNEAAVAASYERLREATKASAQAGYTFRRVRVISEPLSEYQQMALEWSGAAVEAGEGLRWLPRRLVSTVPLPGNDCFVLDGETVMFNVHGGDGLISENQVSRDLDVVKFCRDAIENAWQMAFPHGEYQPRA